MAMCYKKLWKLLIDRDMTRADLRDKTGLSPATLAKMSKGEAIGANVLERICESMQCNVGDVMDYVPETHRIQDDNDGDNLGGGQRTCQM